MGERSDYVNWSIATVIGRKQKRKTDNSCWCAVAWSVITQWTVLEAWFAQRFIFPPFFSRFLFVYFFFSSITSSAWLVDSIIWFIFARRKWEFIPHFLRLHFLVENTLEMACDDFIDYDIELAIRLSALEYAFAYLVWLKPCTSGECTHTHTMSDKSRCNLQYIGARIGKMPTKTSSYYMTTMTQTTKSIITLRKKMN